MSEFDNCADDDILTLEEQILIYNLQLQNESKQNNIGEKNQIQIEIQEAEKEIKTTEDILKQTENVINTTVEELQQAIQKVEEIKNTCQMRCSEAHFKTDSEAHFKKEEKNENVYIKMIQAEHKIKILEDKLREADVERHNVNANLQLQKSKYVAKFSILRRLGLDPNVVVNNISGKKAWIILSPAPITSVSSVGIDQIGEITFSSTGDYKCQQSSLANNSSHDFELDNSQIYYTVFFDCDGKWKMPFKHRRLNTRKYNINLLERHVNDAIDCDFVPVNYTD